MPSHISFSTIRRAIALFRAAEEADLRAHPNRPVCSDLSEFPEPSPATPEEIAREKFLESLTHDELIDLRAIGSLGAHRTPRSRLSRHWKEWLELTRSEADRMPEYLLFRGYTADDLEWALSLLEGDKYETQRTI